MGLLGWLFGRSAKRDQEHVEDALERLEEMGIQVPEGAHVTVVSQSGEATPEQRERIAQQLKAFGVDLDASSMQVAQGPAQVLHVVDEARERIRREGVPGTATITSVEDTGMRFGDNHVVKLRLDLKVGDDDFPISRGSMVPSSVLAGLAVGSSFPVKVDPDDYSQLLAEWEEDQPSASVVTTSTTSWSSGADAVDMQAAMEPVAEMLKGFGIELPGTSPGPSTGSAPAGDGGGVSGRATVLKFQDTGGGSGDEIELRLQLRIAVPGREAYEVEHTERVGRNVAGRLVRGRRSRYGSRVRG